MNKTLVRVLFALTILISIADQIPWHNTRWVEDESWYSDSGATLATEGRARMSSLPPIDASYYIDMRPPAMNLALAASFKLFGVGIWQARLPSYIARTAAIAVIFLLGASYGGLLAGLLAAALLLTDNYLFVAGRTARPEALVTLFMVMTLWLYNQSRERKSLLFTFLASLSAVGAIAFHIHGFAAALSMGILLLIELRLSFWKSARAWCFALVMAAALGAFVLWVNFDAEHYAGYQQVYMFRANAPIGEKLSGEVSRYKDFLGFSNQRTRLPIKIPVRAHIALAILASFLILWRFNRTATIDLAVFVVINMLWWTYQVNKTARYMSDASPLFALVIALAGVALIYKTSWRRTAVCALSIVLVSQLAGNAFIVYSFRNADFAAVARDLRAAIPADRSAWGIITFWLALHDHKYYSYDRTPLNYAISNLKPDYLILNDRVMLNGTGYGVDDLQDLRAQSNAFAKRYATLVAKAPSPFYGPLEIYRVCYGASGVQDCAEK